MFCLFILLFVNLLLNYYSLLVDLALRQSAAQLLQPTAWLILLFVNLLLNYYSLLVDLARRQSAGQLLQSTG